MPFRSDPQVLKDIKTAIEGRSNVLHNATIISHVRCAKCAYVHKILHVL